MGTETEDDNRPRYTTARLRREVGEAKRLARIHALEEAAQVAEGYSRIAPDGVLLKPEAGPYIASTIRLLMRGETA